MVGDSASPPTHHGSTQTMFNDPLQPITGGTDFFRVSDGVYVHAGSTADQPSTFEIKSNIKPSGTSDFVIKRTHAQNDPLGGVDHTAQVYLVVRGDLDKVPEAVLRSIAVDVTTFFAADDNLSRILRGER